MYVYNTLKYELCNCSGCCAISMDTSVLKNRGGGNWPGVAIGPGLLLPDTSRTVHTPNTDPLLPERTLCT